MEQFSQKHTLSQEIILLIYIFIILSHKQLISFVFSESKNPKFPVTTNTVCLSLARDHSFPKLC